MKDADILKPFPAFITRQHIEVRVAYTKDRLTLLKRKIKAYEEFLIEAESVLKRLN